VIGMMGEFGRLAMQGIAREADDAEQPVEAPACALL